MKTHPIHPRWHRASILTIAVAMATALACQPEADSGPSDAEVRRAERVRASVSTLTANLPELLRASAAAHAREDVRALSEVVQQAQTTGVREVDGVRRLYALNRSTPHWLREGDGLTADGEAWLARLREVERTDAIFDEELHRPAIEEGLDVLAVPSPAAPEMDLVPAERERLRRWFQENAEAFSDDRDNLRLTRELIDQGAPLDRFAPAHRQLRDALAMRRRARRDVEILMTDALILYARRLKLDNPVWWEGRTWAQGLALTDETPEAVRADIVRARRLALIEETLGPIFRGDHPAADVLDGLRPPFRQYEALIEAHRQYRSFVQHGGWRALPHSVVGLKAGDEAPEVRLLKARLRAEGMWDGEDSEAYGPRLTEAVTLYQHTHQIWEKGWVTEETWRSMNVPATRRLRRIQQSLARWRSSRIGADDEFIFINIPDFHAEVWRGGERALRMKVVTGSARREWDEEAEEVVRPRATKLFSDVMEYVVFNPYWNVPKGIVEDEILPKLEEEPEYLEENHYEWFETSYGNRVLRQTPGEHNALGLVKFLFPNAHDIYLHDTNEKFYFDYPIRAFSHGCMRVHEPFVLAEYLLKREGKWDEEVGFEQWLDKEGGEVWLKLEEPLPVHIEYVVVRVDDHGRPHFLADVYHLDRVPMTERAAKEVAYGVHARVRALGDEAEPTPSM